VVPLVRELIDSALVKAFAQIVRCGNTYMNEFLSLEQVILTLLLRQIN